MWIRTNPSPTFLSIVLDVNESTIVPDDVSPEDPGAIIKVLVVDNLYSSLENLCEEDV